MHVPDDLRYTAEHEWIRLEGAEGVMGITDFAQGSLGDVVFVELPKPGTVLRQGEPFGVIESNKTVSDLFAPVSGRVLAVNEALRDHPEAVNQDPYGAGWILRVALEDATETESLLDATDYRALVAREQAR